MKKEKDLEKLINSLAKHKLLVHEEFLSQEWDRNEERPAAKKAVVKLINAAVKHNALVFDDGRVVEGLIDILVKYSADIYGNWRAAKVATIALGEIGDQRAVEPLIEVLITGDDMSMGGQYYTLRMEAAEALAKIGDPRAVEPLIEALRRQSQWSEEVKIKAAKALGKIGDPRAAEPLIEALGDLYTSVNEEAAKTLVKIGPSAVEPLIKALKKPPKGIGQPHYRFSLSDERREEIRLWAAEILGKIGDERAVKPLEKALRSKDSYVREEAKKALNKIRRRAKKQGN